ncbi:MAG: hypothetical protein ACI4MZ_01255 [Christensenellales bacterium]
MELSYREMNKSNTDFEMFKKACFELAKQEPDVEYALDGLSDISEMKCLYDENKSVASVVYLMCI